MQSLTPYLTLAIPYLVALSLVILFHELGHFLVARGLGVRVSRFSLGFGPEVFGVTGRTGTRWSISTFPLAGYVRIVDDHFKTPASKNKLSSSRTVDFAQAPIFTRMLIVLAGPIFSIMLAATTLSLSYWWWGSSQHKAVIGDVLPNSAAARGGLHAGDRITTIGGQQVLTFREVQTLIAKNGQNPVVISVKRKSESLLVTVVPEPLEITDGHGCKRVMPVIGIRSALDGILQPQTNSMMEAFYLASTALWNQARQVVLFVVHQADRRHWLDPSACAEESPLLLVEGSPLAPPEVNLVATLSVLYAFITLLPFPIADGGYLVLLLIEGMRGKPVSERNQERLYRVFMFGTVVLVVIAVLLRSASGMGLW